MVTTALCAESKNGVHKDSFGIMFQIESLNTPIDNYTDGGFFGGQGGVGVRYWLLRELVLRGVVNFDFLSDSATDESTTNFGLSLGAEYHFITGIVSPYAGALAGLELLADASGTSADYHLGAVIGVEITALDFLAFFVEYSLLVTFRQTGTEIDFGYNHLPTFGLIIYIN
jgi:hypothetical protein